MTRSRYLSRCLGAALLALLLGACAAPRKTIGLEGPPRPEIGSDVDPAEQLRNLTFEELLSRAAAHTQQGNFELAALHYERALQRQPDSLPALDGLADVFWRRGKPAAAEKVFARALEIAPDHLAALLGAGKSLRALGALERSEQALQRAAELAPDDPEVLTELAICYDHNGDFAQAEALFRQVVASAPQHPGALNNLGFNLLLQRRYAQAVPPLRQALVAQPDAAHIKNNLAAAYLLSGHEDLALALFEGTVGRAGALNNVGYIHLARQEWDAAERAFARALDADPVFYTRANQNLQRVRELRQAP